MRRRHAVMALLATGGAVAAGTLGAPVLAASGQATSDLHGDTFVLFEHDTSQQAIDLGDEGPSVADQFVFGGDVSSTRGGAKRGRMAGTCTSSSPSEILCSAAFTLGDGQITFSGIADTDSFYGGQPTEFAITGGTGRFRKAAGTLTGEILAETSDARFTVDLG